MVLFGLSSSHERKWLVFKGFTFNRRGRGTTWGLNKAHVWNRMLNEILLAVFLIAEASELRTVGGKYPIF